MADNRHLLLLSLGELITQEISAAQLVERIVDLVVKLLEADRGTIYLLDEGHGELVSVAAHLPEIDELRVPLSEGVAGHVASTGEVVNLPSARHDARFWEEIDQRTGYQTESMLAAPLWDARRRLIGVVQLLNSKRGRFSEADAATLADVAEQAAALIEQTTLRHELGWASTLVEGSEELADEAPQLVLGESFNRIVGQGPAMRGVLRDVQRVAPTDATVLLRGESGTGKSLIARALHYNSPRRDGPFVAVDCTTLPETLIENELFGHEKGAYTGADATKRGRVELADGGTLFLDEIGDLSPVLQAKLLNLLQEKTFRRVGGNDLLRADIRILAATNRDLEASVEEGHFREDLYYRLRVVQIEMPPLRQRGRQDLMQLVDHFVEAAAKRHGRRVDRITEEAMAMLLGYGWPGNVRELENCLESAVIFSDGEISPSTLPLPQQGRTRKIRALGSQTDAPPDRFVDEPSLAELEARYIAWLLGQYDGNRSACARVLGIGRNTLLRKIREYGLE
jgi:Nif-specific regulatory protein